MTSPNRPRQLLSGLGALLVLLAVVVGVPVLLTALHLAPHSLPTIHQIGTTLRERDNGGLAVGVIAGAAWLCWALFTLSLVPEVAALARRRPARVWPGLGLFQRPAATLVSAIAIAITVVPAAGVATAGPAHGTSLPALTRTVNATATANPGAPAAPATTPELAHIRDDAGQHSKPGPTYTVARRDTLWGIAQRHLGDPLRYPEIADLNPTKVGPDNQIQPGEVLRMPADATGLAADRRGDPYPASGTITVRPGDTLWDLARAQTGDGQNWHQLWRANRDRAEPNGEHLTNPDLIRPGWTLERPGPAGRHPQTAPADDHTTTRQLPGGSAPAAAQAPTPAASTPAQAGRSTSSVPSATHDAREEPGSTSSAASAGELGADRPAAEHGHRVAFLGATGAALAALSLAALARSRRRQFRHRRPGRIIAGAAPELVDLEQVLTATAPIGSPDVTWLDNSLRGLAQGLGEIPGARLPDVAAVKIAADTLTLVLAEPATQAPEPWSVDASGLRWSIARGSDTRYRPQRREYDRAPYPTLASIGHTSDGDHWLVDLERIGALVLTGDTNRCLDLARFLAAELAHNTWSEMLQVTLVGFGEEMIQANPERLSYRPDLTHTLPAAAARAKTVAEALERVGVDVLDGRLRDVASDAWAPHVLLVAPGAAGRTTADDLDKAAVALASHPRTALAFVAAGEQTTLAAARGWQIHIDEDGTARIPALDLSLTAAQLPDTEAADLARMLALAADTSDHPAPSARGQQPWDAYADACGALGAGQHSTEDRSTAFTPDPAALPRLQLAPSTTAHSADAPTDPSTGQAPDPLATSVDESTRHLVEASDPGLDSDLREWFDSGCRRPRVQLLGRVKVNAQGSLPTDRPREPFHTEVVAYLATRTRPVPSHVYAAAIWPNDPGAAGRSKVTNSISVARAWLGQDPSGQEYLPLGWYESGSAFYQVTQALIDAELFRRLRLRALARGGEAAVEDLWQALRLVTGRPFDHPEPREGAPGGYSWLAEANSRLDHEYAAMIVDTAHTLAQHHIAAGEPELAAQAAQVSLKAGSYEDIPLLDLVEANMAQRNLAEAEAYVQQILANHDAEVEEDLPPRTAEVLFRLRRTWDERAS